jgi:hypothetical protein
VGEHDRPDDRPDLPADALGVVGAKQLGVARQLDRVRHPPALAERTHDPLPAGGTLPGAVDEDDVGHRPRTIRDRRRADGRFR